MISLIGKLLSHSLQRNCRKAGVGGDGFWILASRSSCESQKKWNSTVISVESPDQMFWRLLDAQGSLMLTPSLGASPRFIEIDRVDFIKPVDVGNFLRLKSRVLYTEATSSAEQLINIEVVAHVTSPELRRSEVSNRFYSTFSVRPEAIKDGSRIRIVVPATEEEALRVIERMAAERPISLP